ncbi:chaperone protein TorD [bacterium BMS3Abin01]|nr:chaperone protein TorD [bacterium BMS3Abin01]HDZ59600.1 hypothetical protein [Actinomycetota bacterium]
MIDQGPRDAGQARELAKARAALYRLLSRVFVAKPTEELLRGLKDKEMLDALAAYEVVFGPDFIAAAEEQQARELAVEYTRLFFGPGPHIAPFESVFVRGEGEDRPRLWGQATVEVANFYREAGLEMAEGVTPDHLSLEFEAMAALAQAEADKRVEGDAESAEQLLAMQDRFCREHLLRWVPALCREVDRSSESSFYRNMALLAQNQVRTQCGENDLIC